ncbi:MAG: hypothetical protein JWP36_2772 [Paucimonas sp.]|jgi:curved DNA-binding protein CbpA|nr:hypothetical protein [Paucimonas sp.]
MLTDAIAMPKVHTHYDNLKVTRNAPPEVIRAAYKSLSQKFHPDRNPGDPKATRTFQIINTAYEVLSDPLRRREHDDWIAASEAANGQMPPGQESLRPAGPEHAGPSRNPQPPASSAWQQANWRMPRWQYSMRRVRPVAALRQASGYLFLTAVATLVVLGIVLG